MRRSLAGERHQVVFVSTSAMQKHQCTAIRVFRLVYPMNERQITIDDALFARQSELRHSCPDGIGLFFITGRYEQELTQFLDRLVYCKARCVGCKFEQRSTRFANIERREIFAVVHIDGAGIKLESSFSAFSTSPVSAARKAT